MSEFYRILEELKSKISYVENLLDHGFVPKALKEIDKIILKAAELKTVQRSFCKEG